MTYQHEVQAALAEAPPPFAAAFSKLGQASPAALISAFDSAARALAEEWPIWSGTAHVCAAYCLKQEKQWDQAIRRADMARTIGLSLPGWFYYFDTRVDSLNFLDDLLHAAETAEEAVLFYRNHEGVATL